jgi:hypothetical protein
VSPPEDWEAYSCTFKYYTHRINLDAATHSSVRKCLERAAERYPAYATAWALLSLTYLDEIRFHDPVDPSASPASIDRILTAARRGVELDPQNVRALQRKCSLSIFTGICRLRWRRAIERAAASCWRRRASEIQAHTVTMSPERRSAHISAPIFSDPSTWIKKTRRRYSEKRRGCERRLDRSSNLPGGRAIPRGH